ncbi:MAG: methyltransferase domain-containing protein [Alphaproteobacteria bacterium]|nr:methyltransferase domain-containing protein [Alphaproteobacteria bacterium]
MNGPPPVFDRDLLNLRRLRALKTMPSADFLLTHVADELSSRLTLIRRAFSVALDLAGHTGFVASRLAQHPGIDWIIRAENLFPLVKDYPGTKLVCDPEALPFGDGTLDLVASALSLHLVNDLPGSLVQIMRALRPDGLFLGAVLGGETLSELREVLLLAETEMEGGSSLHVAPFVDVRDMGLLLQRVDFRLPVSDSEVVSVTYDDMFALIKDLRAMGMTNMLHARRRRPLRRSTFFRAAELYASRFPTGTGRIRASFEFVYALGWKAHSSQQEALRPGSARVSLVDVLGDKGRAGGEGPAGAVS